MRVITLLFSSIFLLTVSANANAHDLYKGVISDAHGHIRSTEKLKRIIKRMDENNVDISIIMPRAGISDADALNFHLGYKKRIVPAIGFQNKRWKDKKETFIPHVKKLASSGKFMWLGEVPTHKKLYGEKFVSPQHKMFAQSLQIAEQFRLPVTIHHNLESEDFSLIKELRKRPKAVIVWAHGCGLSAPDKISKWFKEFPNLHCDLAWVNKRGNDSKVDMTKAKVKMTNGNNDFLPEWKALIEANPDRFLIGIDASRGNHFEKGKYASRMKRIRHALGGLDPKVAKMVATENLHRILKK